MMVNRLVSLLKREEKGEGGGWGENRYFQIENRQGEEV